MCPRALVGLGGARRPITATLRLWPGHAEVLG